jgi:ferric-dicitrate binding protein FerR (iron transport regulator)
MSKSDDYLWDRSGEVDPEVARLEELLSPLHHDAPLDEIRLRRKRSLPVLIAMVAAAAAVLALVWWRWPRTEPTQLATCTGTTGFKLIAQGGAVACNGARVESGELAVGSVVETGAARAEVHYQDPQHADIHANLTFSENTRVRLAKTSADHHELYLERGKLHAFVSAPPRLFAVTTPSTQVTDLGCEYTLTVDDRGAGMIEVLTGKVELATGTGAIVVAPKRTRAHLMPGRRPGVPLYEAATAEMESAVRAFEANEPGGVARVLAVAGPQDAITVADMSLLVSADQKRAVLEKLQTLVPIPQSTTIDEVIADNDLWTMWFDEVVLRYMQQTVHW